jgi:hypothetical protein
MDQSTKQYSELLDLLLALEGEKHPKWGKSLFANGFEFDIVGGGSIILTDFNNAERSTKGFALSVFGVGSIGSDPFLVENADNQELYEKMAKLFDKAKKEAAANTTDLSEVLNQVRSIAR